MHTQQSLQCGCFPPDSSVCSHSLCPHRHCTRALRVRCGQHWRVPSMQTPFECACMRKTIRATFAWARLACRDAHCRDFAHLWPGETWCLDPGSCVANRPWPALFSFTARQACVGQLCVTMSALACMDLADSVPPLASTSAYTRVTPSGGLHCTMSLLIVGSAAS